MFHTQNLFSDCFVSWDRVAQNPGWPRTCSSTEDDLDLLSSLPGAPKYWDSRSVSRLVSSYDITPETDYGKNVTYTQTYNASINHI